MKQTADKSTLELELPGGARRGRGRPAIPMSDEERQEKKRLAAAERKARSRAAKAGSVSALTVELSAEVMDGLREYMKFKDLTQAQVIEKLLRAQLLRKR